MTTREERRLRRMRPKPEKQCLICLRPQREVRVLVQAGTDLYLCDGCVADLALVVEEKLGLDWYRSGARESEP
jgi:ClpX C4-type zinc finger